jgi:hypothetical protein
LQKIIEEEMKNKEMLLEGSFNTIFSNGAIDSIYSNRDSINLANLINLENNNEKNEEEEYKQIKKIIENIEKYEDDNNYIDIKVLEPSRKRKKQIIYKKEFKNIRSLSKSTHFQNGQEVKEKKEIDEKNNNNDEYEYENHDYKNNNRKSKKPFIKNYSRNRNQITRKSVTVSENNKIDNQLETNKTEDIEEKNNKLFNLTSSSNFIIDYSKKAKEIIDKKNQQNTIEKSNNNKVIEDEIVINNKRKKVIILKGNRHYFIKNKEKKENNEKNNENNRHIVYKSRNENKKIIYKSNNFLQNKTQVYHSKKKNNVYINSFSQNKNLSKDNLSKSKQNLILYKKKLINDNRGLSISRKNIEIDHNDNRRTLHKVNTIYTINGSTIVPVRKYINNDQRESRQKTENDNDSDNDNGNDNDKDKDNENDNDNNDNDDEFYFDKKKRFLTNDTFMNTNDDQSDINLNYYKTITYSGSNFGLNDISKKAPSINGNIYYKKNKINNLFNSHMDKSCPKKYNKFSDDIHKEIKETKGIINHNNSIEEKNIEQNSNNTIINHRYHQRLNQYNNKKFKLRPPKNYYKINLY